MENLAQKEIMFYQDGQIKVTQTRYITHSKTYAMRNISSVHLFEIVKSRRLPAIIITIGILLLFSDEVRLYGIGLLLFGALILFFTKNDFAVRISTNAGEVNSIVSKDRNYILQIVNALNEAIIHIG